MPNTVFKVVSSKRELEKVEYEDSLGKLKLSIEFKTKSSLIVSYNFISKKKAIYAETKAVRIKPMNLNKLSFF